MEPTGPRWDDQDSEERRHLRVVAAEVLINPVDVQLSKSPFAAHSNKRYKIDQAIKTIISQKDYERLVNLDNHLRDTYGIKLKVQMRTLVKEKECIICEKRFTPSTPMQICCSPPCSQINKNNKSCAWQKIHRPWRNK